jgi:hypothetical protein
MGLFANKGTGIRMRLVGGRSMIDRSTWRFLWGRMRGDAIFDGGFNRNSRS